MEWIAELFRDWFEDWKTKKGLAGYSLVIVFVVGGLLLLLRQLGLAIPPIWSILIIACSVTLHVLYWGWEYIIYPMYIGKIKIAFSLEIPGRDPLLDELRQEFCSQLDSLNLMGKIKVLDVPSDKRFETNTEAEEYSRRKDINLLVWGHMKKGQLEGQQVAEFRLKFTCVYPKVSKKKIEELLQGDVKLAVVDRNWRIAVDNSFADIDAVARNLMEISLFIIGLCLLLWKDTERCLEVFEKLRTCLQRGPQIKDKKRTAFQERFDYILIQALDLRAMYLYQSDQAQECKKDLERMLQINNAIPGAHINLARLCYKDGNMRSARYHTNQADQLKPNNPLSIINRAFFAILDRKFQKAAGFYNRLPRAKDWSMGCNTLEVALFLEDERKKHKDNLGLLYAAGFMNYHFVDKRRGRLQLKNFVKIVTKKNLQKQYGPLFIVAQQTTKPGNR
jgi:tetratricopeptide (TPR) repeat protein